MIRKAAVEREIRQDEATAPAARNTAREPPEALPLCPAASENPAPLATRRPASAADRGQCSGKDAAVFGDVAAAAGQTRD